MAVAMVRSMGQAQAAALQQPQWSADEEEPPTLRLVDDLSARPGLPSVRLGRFGDRWIGPRIALDARLALLADTLGETRDRGRVYRLARLLGDLRDVRVALDAIVETADASPEIAGRLTASLAQYVDDVYAWCASGGAAIHELAVFGVSAVGAAQTGRRFRHDLARTHAVLEAACRAHGSMAAWRLTVQATGLRAEMAQFDADLRTEAT
jgi:hypothetical protein